MALERSNVIYPNNGTTVDTGVGIDVRVLAATNGGTNDATQTATATHTQDNVERTFDPATSGVTNTNNAGTTLFKTGWALRLTEDMTPVDDTDCNAALPAGTLTISLNVTVNQAGGTYATGTYAPTWRASLWRYNVSADTGTLIAAGSNSATSWDFTPVTGDLGTFKTIAVSVVDASAIEFSAGEVLLLQVGLNTGTIPNPTLGTATITYTLRVDSTNTKIAWASGQNITQNCVFSNSMVGVGTLTKGAQDIAVPRTLSGIGTLTSAKAASVAKSFSLTGIGSVSDTHPVQAFRSFDLVGIGTVSGKIEIPIDKVPTGSGGTTIRPVFFLEE